MAEKFDYLLTLGADADAIVEEVESKIKEAKASVKNQVLTISNVKIDDKGVLNNFIKELQSLAKSNAIKLDIDFSSFTQYQDNIESMQRMIDALNKTQIKNNITANLDREITVTKKDLASLTDQIDAYWEKIYRKGNTTKEGFGKEFYKGNQLYTKYISNIKEVQNLLSGKKIIDLDEKEIVTVYTYLVEIEKIHARLNASNRTLKDKTKLFDLSAGDFNYKSLITEAEKQMENFRRKFTTELMTYQKDQASALLNPLVESLKQAQEIAKNINKADSTIKLIDEEQVKSSSNEVTKLINKVKELEENKKKLSSKIEGLESKIPLDMSNLTEKDSMRLEEINRLKDEFTDLDRQIFKINSTIEVYKKLNLDGEIGSSILSVKELNKNLDEETLSLKDVQKELKKYGNIYKDLSFDEVINKMKEFNTQFDKLKAEGKNKIGNAEFTSLKNEIGSLYKYAIENKYDLSGLGSFNAIAKTFSNGLKIDEEAITKLQNQEKWHQHIIDRIQEEIRLKEKSVNVSQNTISQEQEQKHEHETVARESVSDQIVSDQSKNVLELIEQAKTLNALLADMKEQLGSLTGKPFEEMQVKIFNVNNELNDTLVKIENLKEKTQKDIEVKFKVDNSSLNNVEKIKQDSLEDKLEKLGLTKENALAMAQDITDKIAIDEKTGIYTETDNLIQTVTEYHDKIKDTNAYIQKGNDLIEERAILLKQGLQVGEEYVMSDATGKVDIGNGIKKHNADSVLHTHVFSDEVNNLRFSDADIKELVDGTVKKALLLCGNEIATLDMTNVDAGDFESLRNDILGAYTAVFARFGTEIKDGKLVDITSLPPDIQNQAADIVNNLVRNIIQNYGGDLVFDKIVDNDFEANDDVRLPKIEASEMEIVQKYIDAITSDKPAENIITLQKQFGVLKTSIQDVQKETNEISKSISPSQEFDNDIQRNLVSLENYKNTIKEIDKLKLEPETEETKAKIEELTELSKYFLKNISIIRSEVGGEISIASMKDGFGRFNIGLRERYDSDKLSELYDIGNENIGLEYSSIKSEFSGIDDEISRIEQSSESLRLSLTQTTQNSEKYVKNLKRQLMIMASAQEDLKTEKNPRWIEGFNRDIEKAISKFPELERFKEKFTTGSSAKSFINSDEWNEFLSTLPQAKAYLEFIGYEFKEISKVNQTSSSPTLFEDSSGQLSFIEQTEKAVDLIEEESGQMAMFENIAEKATDSAIEGQKTLNDYIDKNIEGQMTLNDLMDKQDDHREVEQTEILLGADKPIQEAEQYEQVSKDTASVLSDIGLSYDELIAKIKAETKAIEAGNASFKERLTFLDAQGNVIKSYLGEKDFVYGIGNKYDGAIKAIHTHPSVDDYGGNFSTADIFNFTNEAIYNGLKEVELVWRDKIVNLDFSGMSKESIEKFADQYGVLKKTLMTHFNNESDGGMFKNLNEQLKNSEYTVSIMQKLISDLGGNVTSNQDLIDIDEAELGRILELFKQIEHVYSQVGENTTPEQIGKLEEELLSIRRAYKVNQHLNVTSGIKKSSQEETNKQEISSNEEVIASEEKKRKYKVAAKNEIPKLAKQESSAVIDANTDVIESNEEVIESEEKVRKYRVANRNDVPKLKSKSDISDSQDISDTSDVSENISKIDALKKKIEELGFSAKETEAILKSIDDGSLFRIDWSNDDEYKKIQKLLSYLKEYGYLVKNVKEDTDAFSYVGNITTPEKEKEIQETSKAYKDLTKDVKKYFELKNKEVKNNLTETDRKKLAELEAEIKDATTAQNKYANATGEAAEAQKKFNAEVEKYKDNSGQNYITDVSKKLKSIEGADGKTKAYLDQIATIKAKIEELDKILPIDLTNQVEIDQLKKAQAEINKMMDSLSDKKFNSAVSQADTWTTRISQFLKQNSAAPKELLGQVENVQKRIVQLRNSVEGINEIQLKELTDEFKNLQAQITSTGKTGISFGDKIARKLKDLGAYLLTYVSFQDTIQVLRQGFETIKEYDTALTEMNKVSEKSLSVLKEFQKESFDLADNIGTTGLQVQNSVADWQRLGESLEEAKQSAQDANILFNVSEFESINEATDSLVSMSQAFKDLEKGEIIDVVNNLGNNFAISTDGLATALKDSASSLQTAQNDFFESAALVTAANTVVQDPAKVGAGLRTIALRLTGTEAARDELAALGEDVDDFIVTTSSKLDQQIKDLTKTQGKFGVSLLDMNGNYRSTYEVLLDIAKVWDQIAKEDLVTGENRQNALLELMAGKNRSNILASVLQSPEILEEAYSYAIDSEGSALKENESYLESIEAHISQLKNAWDSLWINENNREIITFFLDLAKAVLEAVDEFGALKTLLIGGGGIFGAFKAIKGDGRPKMFGLVKNMPSVMKPLMDT